MEDLIANKDPKPSLEEIEAWIDLPGRALWTDMNTFVREQFKAQPKTHYSSCSAKPGWNIKYQKSGKALCTLYPEKDGFTALVVVMDRLGPAIENAIPAFHAEIVRRVKETKPFNGTLWLMLPVKEEAVLESVKDLLEFKACAC